MNTISTDVCPLIYRVEDVPEVFCRPIFASDHVSKITGSGPVELLSGFSVAGTCHTKIRDLMLALHRKYEQDTTIPS